MEGLRLNNKQKWAAHCEQYYVPLYFRPWWMDCVCSKENWDVCLSLNGSGQVEGALVYYLKQRYGMRIITSPPLTTYSGLWLHPPINMTKPSSRMAFEKRVCENLLKQLPPHTFFYQQWHPDVTNWLPYFWKGFQQTTLYTYRIEMSSNSTSLYKNLERSARTDIKHASRLVRIISFENQLDVVFDYYRRTLQQQNKKVNFSFKLFSKLDFELSKRGYREILAAIDDKRNIHAILYLVRDEECTYFLLTSTNPMFRYSRSVYLLFWEAISRSIGKTKTIDLEGSTLENVELFLRAFSGTLTPHFKITRAANKWLDALYQLRSS